MRREGYHRFLSIEDLVKRLAAPALSSEPGARIINLFMKCPTCGKPVEWNENPYRPFCSERCKLIDLGHWVNEEYQVPGETVPIAEGPENPQSEND